MQGHEKRIELIGRVQFAYEQVKDAMAKAHGKNSKRARIAVAAAKHRLSLLNRALAMLALESAQAA